MYYAGRIKQVQGKLDEVRDTKISYLFLGGLLTKRSLLESIHPLINTVEPASAAFTCHPIQVNTPAPPAMQGKPACNHNLAWPCYNRKSRGGGGDFSSFHNY